MRPQRSLTYFVSAELGHRKIVMLRFAVVQPGPRAAAIVRVASRLRGGVVSAVVDHDDAAAQSLAKQLGAKVVASSVEQLHQ